MHPYYAQLLTQAALAAQWLLEGALARAQITLKGDLAQEHNPALQAPMSLALDGVERLGPALCEAYPQALRDAHRSHSRPGYQSSKSPLTDLKIEQLELMDQTQVQERIERVRALQSILFVVSESLLALDAHVCAMQELDQIDPGRNPLRPDVYLSSLQVAMTRVRVPRTVRVLWLQHLAGPLGNGLNAIYVEWLTELRQQGVLPLGARGPQQGAQMLAGLGTGRSQSKAQVRESLLTLERLRRLIAGEYQPPARNAIEAYSKQFEREFEAARKAEADLIDSQFFPTIPAAYETLQELKQVDQVVQRIEQQPVPADVVLDPGKLLSERDKLFRRADGVGERLSLEVVALMVDNLVSDTRLMWPIRQVIARLEIALLQLVLVDVRFFIDRHHPARLLLQEVAERGLAFGSTEDAQFNYFLVALQRYLIPLADADIDSAEPFEVALKSLRRAWREAAVRSGGLTQLHTAVAALEGIEKRHVLARRVAAGIRAISGFAQTPKVIAEFLLGPWSQVVASAQLSGEQGVKDPGGYKAVVKQLLWSADPALASQNLAKLRTLAPRLLSKLREGMRLIDYPAAKTSGFFDQLMKLHQRAVQAQDGSAEPGPELSRGASAEFADDNPDWVAPAEASASGFITLSDDLPASLSKLSLDGVAPVEVVAVEETAMVEPVLTTQARVDKLTVGAWVELLNQGVWSRTQLGWISPQRTMYLFTSVHGKTQSMTKRMLERLVACGELKLLTERSVVDGALDAVVQTATLNSLDLRLD
jgi:hypothetical protein